MRGPCSSASMSTLPANSEPAWRAQESARSTRWRARVFSSRKGQPFGTSFADRLAYALSVAEHHDTELVQDERVVGADLLRSVEVLLCERQIGESEVLHADEEHREVRAGQVALRG